MGLLPFAGLTAFDATDAIHVMKLISRTIDGPLGPLPYWFEGTRLAHAFSLAEATPSLNVIKGMHFQAYKTLRRKWATLVISAVGSFPEVPIERVALVVVRHSAGPGLDWDNAFGGLKPLLDCMVAASARNPSGIGLFVDDNPTNMPFPPLFRQIKAKRGAGRTDVYIFELDTAPIPAAA